MLHPIKAKTVKYTVNPEIFVRVLFSRHFAESGKFLENKTFAK